MEHYYCPGGCGGVSETPSTCNADGCSHHGQPMEKCACPSMDGHAKKEEVGQSPAEVPADNPVEDSTESLPEKTTEPIQ